MCLKETSRQRDSQISFADDSSEMDLLKKENQNSLRKFKTLSCDLP